MRYNSRLPDSNSPYASASAEAREALKSAALAAASAAAQPAPGGDGLRERKVGKGAAAM